MISVFDTNNREWVRRNFDEYDLDEVLEEEYYVPIADSTDVSDEIRQEIMEAIENHNEDYLGYITLDCVDGEEELPYWLSDGLRKAIWEEM